MATHYQRDEQKAQAQVKAIIDEMLELDPETRVRAYRPYTNIRTIKCKVATNYC